MADAETAARVGGLDPQAFIDAEIAKLDAIKSPKRRRKLRKGWHIFESRPRRLRKSEPPIEIVRYERADPHR